MGQQNCFGNGDAEEYISNKIYRIMSVQNFLVPFRPIWDVLKFDKEPKFYWYEDWGPKGIRMTFDDMKHDQSSLKPSNKEYSRLFSSVINFGWYSPFFITKSNVDGRSEIDWQGMPCGNVVEKDGIGLEDWRFFLALSVWNLVLFYSQLLLEVLSRVFLRILPFLVDLRPWVGLGWSRLELLGIEKPRFFVFSNDKARSAYLYSQLLRDFRNGKAFIHNIFD